MSLMVLANPTQLTHHLYLEKVTPPLRIRVRAMYPKKSFKHHSFAHLVERTNETSLDGISLKLWMLLLELQEVQGLLIILSIGRMAQIG